MTSSAAYQNKSAGFVLPYVLLVIAILSFSLILIAQRMQNSSRLLIKLESQFTSRIALNSAEAEAIYALMVSVPANNGYELNPKKGLNLFRIEDQDKALQEVWSANGEARQSVTPHGPVIAQLRDGSGYIPINNINEEVILALTKSLGVPTQKRKSLTAKLLDYIDEDSRRQFLGGERSDYRLRQLSPPTNASLRRIGELNNVMEWNELISTIDYKAIVDRVTLNPGVKTVKMNFIEPSFAKQLSLGFQDTRSINSLLRRDNYPTNVIRLAFYYRDFENNVILRKIEVDKTIATLEKPFSRQILYEDVLDIQEEQADINHLLSDIEGRKHVIYAKAYRYQ